MKGFGIVASSCFLVCFFVMHASAQPMSPPVPPFLQGADPSLIKQFEQLISSSGSLTDAQIDAKVDQWVAQQSDDIKTKYASFKAQLQKVEAEAEARHQASIAKFSPAAKEADAKLSAIANNPALTAQQKGQQIYQMMNSLPENVRDEIQREMMGPMGH